MSLIQKISSGLKYHKTYQIGLLQTKAYRILKHRTTKLLEHKNISSVEWALLGLLYDSKNGMRLSALAHELGVEAPFVTTMSTNLSKLGYMKHMEDPDDSRAKVAHLTALGKRFVDETEKYLKKEMIPLFKDLDLSELASYLQVLISIINNS